MLSTGELLGGQVPRFKDLTVRQTAVILIGLPLDSVWPVYEFSRFTDFDRFRN
jgi:hypothetical protein